MWLALIGISKGQVDKAVQDIWTGLNAWPLWSLLGLNDVRMRYRRSTLGPFWGTLSMGFQISITGVVMTLLFHTTLRQFLPFLSIGLIIWTTLTAMVTDGSQAFIGSADLILQVRRPLSVYLFQIMWRNMVVAAHSIVIFFVVAFLFHLFPGPTYILAVPGLMLFLLNCVWLAGVAAIMSTRFRDIPMIVANIFTGLFWLTPVLYDARQLGETMERVVNWNPLYHIVEVFRAPLLLVVPTATDWLVSLGTALIGWLFLVLLFARTRNRIPFWL